MVGLHRGGADPHPDYVQGGAKGHPDCVGRDILPRILQKNSGCPDCVFAPIN